MSREQPSDSSAHQPSKAELEENVSIDATPEALAWAITRGGAERSRTSVETATAEQENAKEPTQEEGIQMPDNHIAESAARTPTPNEMLLELIQLGYIVPAHDAYCQPIMPSAYQTVPSCMTADSIPAHFGSDGT